MGYRPRIQRGGAVYDLPLPIRQSTEQHKVRVRKVHVPLQDGVIVANAHVGELVVNFTGTIVIGNPQDGDRAIGQVASIMAEKVLLENQLKDTTPFTLYRYITGATVGGVELGDSTYNAWYGDCTCTSLHFNWTHRTVDYLPYTFSILVPSGVMNRDV